MPARLSLEEWAHIGTIAGALVALSGFIYAILPSKSIAPPSIEPPPTIAPIPPTLPSIVTVGNCNLDANTTTSLLNIGLHQEILHLCKTGKASTVGPILFIPTIHYDEKFQSFNPVEFNNLHEGQSSQNMKDLLYKTVSEKLAYCFSTSSEQGASPHERIGLERDCLQKNGMRVQDQVYLMIVENAHAEGRNVSI